MIKKILILCIVSMFLLSGCEQLKELYGIQTTDDEYVPLEEIKMEEEEDLPPQIPEDDEIEGEVVLEEVEEIIEEVNDDVLDDEEILEEVEEIIEEVEETTEVEVVDEIKGAGSKVVIVEETELVSLTPKAIDPDQDQLEFIYTSPLTTEGKWKTDYGDAGEYTVTVTASDGELSATKDVLIIVNKKEELPVINQAIPAEDALNSKEASELKFSIQASDLNNDALDYTWKLDGNEVSKEDSYTYDVGYDGAGQHTVKIAVADGAGEASKIWTIKIDNVNRKPVLVGLIEAISVKETEKVILSPKANDPDSDDLVFSVDSDKFKQVDGQFEWDTTYDDAGDYTITITVSDGTDAVSQKVEVNVGNVNRAPVIDDIVLG